MENDIFFYFIMTLRILVYRFLSIDLIKFIRMKTTKCLCLITILVVIISCKKNRVDVLPVSSSLPFSVEKVQVSIDGTIINEQGQLVVGANVTIGNTSTTTAANGKFAFYNLYTMKYATNIKVAKEGYISSFKTILVTKNNVMHVKIILNKPTREEIFNTIAGIDISANHCNVKIPSNSIAYSTSKKVYNGAVRIKLCSPAITDSFYYEKMAGGHIGIDNQNRLSTMQQLGVISVEMTDTAGNELQLQENKRAEITLHIPNSLINKAKSTIGIWHFDEILGYWRQNEECAKENNTYKMSVNHFSWWCWGGSLPTFFKYASVRDNVNNQLLYGCGLLITTNVAPHFNVMPPYSDYSEAYFEGSDTSTGTIEVIDECNNIIYNYTFDLGLNIGSASTAVSSSILNSITISGTIVDCANNPTQQVHLIMEGSSIPEYQWVNSINVYANGSFNINLSLCKVGDTLQLNAFDINGLTNGSYSFIVPSTNLNIGSLSVCQNLSNYIGDCMEPEYKFTCNQLAGGITKIQATRRPERGVSTGTNVSFDGNYTQGLHQLIQYNYNSKKYTPWDFYSFNVSNDTAIIPITISHYSSLSGDSITGNFSGMMKSEGKDYTTKWDIHDVAFRFYNK
jgi:hypothetical protein